MFTCYLNVNDESVTMSYDAIGQITSSACSHCSHTSRAYFKESLQLNRDQKMSDTSIF